MSYSHRNIRDFAVQSGIVSKADTVENEKLDARAKRVEEAKKGTKRIKALGSFTEEEFNNFFS